MPPATAFAKRSALLFRIVSDTIRRNGREGVREICRAVLSEVEDAIDQADLEHGEDSDEKVAWEAVKDFVEQLDEGCA